MRKKANLAFQLWVGKKELTLKISDFRSPSPLLTLFRFYKPLPISKKNPLFVVRALSHTLSPTYTHTLIIGRSRQIRYTITSITSVNQTPKKNNPQKDKNFDCLIS